MSNGLVVVGSVALDSVEANGTLHDDVLGGSASFFATAASYFAPVKLVAVVGADMPEEHLQFLGSREDPSGGGGFAGGGAPQGSDIPVDDRDFQPAPVSSSAGDDDIPF